MQDGCCEIQISRKSFFCCVFMCNVSGWKLSPRRAQNVCIFLHAVLTKHFVLTSWRKMSNKCKGNFFPTVYKFMYSISAKPVWNSFIFIFKAVLSVNSIQPDKHSAEDFSGLANCKIEYGGLSLAHIIREESERKKTNGKRGKNGTISVAHLGVTTREIIGRFQPSAATLSLNYPS